MIIRYSHILFIIILSSLVYAGDIDSTWWQASYELGLRHLQAGNTDSAEIQYNSIIEKDDTIAEAYFGLALVSLQEDSSDEDAEDNLRKAVKLKPKLTDAWMELAVFMERNSIPPSVEALNILAAGLHYNSKNNYLYKRYISLVFWNSEEGRSVAFLDTLSRREPANLEIRFDLSRLYYNLGKFKESLAILNSLDQPFSKISLFQLNLLRAKNYFEIDQVKRGLAYYWQAVNSIKNEADLNIFISDLHYIISDAEYEELQNLNILQVRSFFDRFWRSRDPHLASDFNQRIPEHYNRIFYARKYYRRYIHLGDKKSNFKIYKFSHPNRKYGVTIGDSLLSPLVYKALTKDRDLDDMGLIYVRHGEPDKRINHLCEDCILNFSWHYYKTYNRPEMIFHFIKHGTSRGWMMESMASYFENRGELGYPYMFLDPTRGEDYETDVLLTYYQRMDEDNKRYAKQGVRSETSGFKIETESLTLPYKFLSFKGERRETNIELYYGLQGRDIELKFDGRRKYLRLLKFIGIYDDKWNEVFNAKKEDKVPISLDQQSWEGSIIMRMEHFNAPPGNYFYEFHVKDENSNRSGLFKNTYPVPDYHNDSLALSDILLSAPIKISDDKAFFKKGNIIYSPHMFTPFAQNEKLGLYFEVYNLLYDWNDRTHFIIKWTLSKIDDLSGTSLFEPIGEFFGNLFGGEKESIISTLEYDGTTRDDKVYFNLDLQDRDNGRYQIIITVEDKISTRQADKKVEFVIK